MGLHIFMNYRCFHQVKICGSDGADGERLVGETQFHMFLQHLTAGICSGGKRGKFLISFAALHFHSHYSTLQDILSAALRSQMLTP